MPKNTFWDLGFQEHFITRRVLKMSEDCDTPKNTFLTLTFSRAFYNGNGASALRKKTLNGFAYL